MKTGPDLEQAAHAAADRRTAGRRRGNSRQHLEQRRLARAIAADHAEYLSLRDLEGDVPQRPDLLVVMVPRLPNALDRACDRVSQRPVATLQLADAIALGKSLCCDRGRHRA